MKRTSNTIFTGSDFIVMPSDAVSKLTPMAYDVLGRIITHLYNNPNWSLTINNIMKGHHDYKANIINSLHELADKGFLQKDGNDWNICQNEEV